MGIEEVKFTRFYAAEHVQFGTEVCEVIEEAPFKEELPSYPAYRALHEEEKQFFKKEGGNLLTPEVEQSDETRDIHTYGFFMVVKGMLHHYDEEVISAAGVVSTVLKPFKKVCKITFEQETATLDKMVVELRKEDVAKAVERLGFTEWVNRIAEDNRQFAALQMQRSFVNTLRLEGNMKGIRSRVDPAFFDVALHLNSLIVVNGLAPYEATVKLLNERINSFKRTISQRQAAAARKKAAISAVSEESAVSEG
jgi:hypothetical protein